MSLTCEESLVSLSTRNSMQVSQFSTDSYVISEDCVKFFLFKQNAHHYELCIFVHENTISYGTLYCFVLSALWFNIPVKNLSRVMRKPTFCICKNKGTDQLRSNCKADQHLCFRYTGSTIPLLS